MNGSQEKRTILIIEDDADILTVIRDYLKHLNYEIITAADGMEGLKKLESGGYDLVITDIVMPYVSGVGVVTAVKERDPHIPVIGITGYGKEPQMAATEKKADLVLAKPIELSVLENHIARLLKSKD